MQRWRLLANPGDSGFVPAPAASILGTHRNKALPTGFAYKCHKCHQVPPTARVSPSTHSTSLWLME